MKKLLVIFIAAIFLVSGCVTTTPSVPATSTTSVIQTTETVTGTLVPFVEMPVPGPSSTMYPDDIVVTPGGYAYRGNVQEQGQVNPWPSIEVVTESLPAGSVSYRAEITTNAGQVRNNLIALTSETFRTGEHQMDVYAAGVPGDIKLERSAATGLQSQKVSWVRIDVPASTIPGDYVFTLALAVDGVFGGFLPVTVHVVSETVNTPTAPVTTTS